ncbi:MAG: hypothetical protein IJ309_03810 [Clostridia bacterium]|nr:hypothetical protein [Clostridia bacterium]
MNYTPKHNDKGLRILYFILFFLTVLFLMVNNPTYRWLYLSLAMLSLVGAVYLLLSFELTTYTYVLNAKEKSYDFFVDKATGKRNAYVCYYPMADLVYLGKQEKDTKDKLNSKYKKIFFYRYAHNLFNANSYIMVFKNKDYYDAITLDLNDEYLSFINKVIRLQSIELEETENKES